MSVIQAQLIAGLVITCLFALVPLVVDIVYNIRAKRTARKLAAQQLQMERDLYANDKQPLVWLNMKEDLFGHDPIEAEYDYDELVDLDKTCEFDHNKQG